MSTELEHVPPPIALSTEVQREAGILALGRMTDAQFADRLTVLKSGMDRLEEFIDKMLKPGVDVMVIPGTKKPSLLQPGAEKLCFLARFVPTYVVTRSVREKDREDLPAVHYLVQCDLHLGSTDGPVIAEGVGSCNTHEVRYRYRKGERKCPECGQETLFKSKFPDKKTGKKGWYCYAKKGGCGAEFAEDDERIMLQNVEALVENEEPFDLDNTMVKMAKKRALIDATKTATGGSARLTQDMEDVAKDAEARAVRDIDHEDVGAGEPADRGPDAAPEKRGQDPAPASTPGSNDRVKLVNELFAVMQKKSFTLDNVFSKVALQRPDNLRPKQVADLKAEEILWAIQYIQTQA